MFPPNLKKNIREIDRQITLLESECKNMEPEQNESLSTVVLSKVAIRELPSKPFITGPILEQFKKTNFNIHDTDRVMMMIDDGNDNDTNVTIDEKQNLKRSEKITCTKQARKTEEENFPIIFNSSTPKKIFHKEVLLADTEEDELKSDCLELKKKTINEIPPMEHLSVKTNRFRSARTKRKSQDEIPIDISVSKGIQEKKIQCMIGKEEKEKYDFLINLNDSIKNLNLLIEEFKKKSLQDDKENEVLNEMQNTLTKLNKIKSSTTLNCPINYLLNENGGFLIDNNDSDGKKVLLSVKKYCEQLTEEKTFLSEELTIKNRTIASMKNKEKEYLSLISSLKFSLEKAKEQAEDCNRCKKELNLVKTKLNEEGKIIEALQRSHDKMQDLVENYVLENDKLRTQLKITKLETQKYNVLLSSKEEEIKKYKFEMGSFQRQICEQLSLLRSKASENQVENALKTFADQAGLLSQTENESGQTNTNEYSDRISFTTSKTSLESIWSRGVKKSKNINSVVNVQNQDGGNDNFNDCEYTSCKSDDSDRDEIKLDENDYRRTIYKELFDHHQLK
ncbi:paramyosin, long form, putative [Pediculus humanus corporis]|uniref:Paramyosin, long form, putative n=1 Tax=Pediculus humanus subsp. corporis TaxID=121224 RepID=E0VIM8_PEDHC|nr:paramyosin, long form, putative [Pediculus humanus corporis]EEB13234.1 paramyosin, long form, putative [Pediculus humanus corporis]